MTRQDAIAEFRAHKTSFKADVASWGGRCSDACPRNSFEANCRRFADGFGLPLTTPAQWVAVAQRLAWWAADRKADLGPCP